MLRDIDQYFLNKPEPTKSCLLVLRDFIPTLDENLGEAWKYSMPFFCYRGKMFCYLWTDKKTGEPYIGIVEGNRLDHHMLEAGERARMKILRINPNEDIPLDLVKSILNEALEFYRNGTIKIKGG